MKPRQLALTLALTALAGHGFAQQSDADFAAAFSRVQALARSSRGRFIKTTQEIGPNDPILLMQKPRIDLVKKVLPSIVVLEMSFPKEPRFGTKRNPFDGKEHPEHALCTGFFIDSSAYLPARPVVIQTNSHCVEDLAIGASVDVGLYNGSQNAPTKTKGKVLAYGNSDVAKDVALVELEDASLNRRGLPLWDRIDPGEMVVAIGHPKGLLYSVSQGIVSALRRDRIGAQFILDQTQSDAAINSGNSGGPLFNLWGSVIGINSMIGSNSGGFEGLSFSVPSRLMVEELKQFARTGNLKPGSIGIEIGAEDGALLVKNVFPDSTALRADVKSGDRLIGVDDLDIATLAPGDASTEFIIRVKYRSPGEIINLRLLRAGKPLTLPVTVGEPTSKPQPTAPNWAPLPLPEPAPALPSPHKRGYFGNDPSSSPIAI